MADLKYVAGSIWRSLFNRKFSLADNKNVNTNATTVKTFYKGFTHIIAWDDTQWYMNKLPKASDWCDKNCKGTYFSQIHCVYFEDRINDWVIDELKGKDFCFWVFENEEDAIMFSLKW